MQKEESYPYFYPDEQFLIPVQSMSADTELRVKKLFLTLYSKYNVGISLKNRSKILLGLDLLRDKIKYELLQVVTLTVEEVVLESLATIRSAQVYLNPAEILNLILTRSIKRFFAKYYGMELDLNASVFQKSLYTRVLHNDATLLVKIPFSAIFNNTSNNFRLTFSPLYETATDRIIEVLFDNLMINISEAIVRIIVNEFSLIADIQRTWFRSNFLSLRNLERFKNNMAWQDRQDFYLRRPTEIYNNKYNVWLLTADGFYQQSLYANRLFQLLKLKSGSLTVINYVEFQDFVLCRLEEIIVFTSDRTRYFLTYILGQTIGLIWKGIIDTLKE